ITTVSGDEFLFQSDIDFLILDWFHAIKNAIDRLPKERSCTSRNLEFKLRRSSSIELLNSLDTESKEPKPEHRKSLIFRLNYSASDTNDRNRVKSRLKKFISRRPSLKTLQEKGLIKDQIFGSHLHLVCEHEKSTVPQFVRLCIKAVERRGLDVDGIYRVSGNLATIQKLRFVVNQGIERNQEATGYVEEEGKGYSLEFPEKHSLQFCCGEGFSIWQASWDARLEQPVCRSCTRGHLPRPAVSHRSQPRTGASTLASTHQPPTSLLGGVNWLRGGRKIC
ncbi:PREDICTED: rho GTPase-activating protein 15, partial [Phaethon lepturus]|uniref:rho GTPase-activating protein 15 n=1 Tax=Phaethon lepturus TaxID=97097 RepID=UPI00053055A2